MWLVVFRRGSEGAPESVEDVVSGALEGVADSVNMGLVAGFEFDSDCASADCGAGVDAFVVYGNDIAALLGDYGADARELAGFVGEVDLEGEVTPGFREAAGDDAAERRDVDVAA